MPLDVPPGPAAELRACRLAMLDRLAVLNMEAAEIAAEQIRSRNVDTTENPHLALTRATRAVTHVIAIENRLIHGEPAPRAPSRVPAKADPRRLPLRQTLHEAVQAEPDRAARNQLRRMIDDRIDEELAADPDCEIPINEALMTIADDLGIRIDVSQLSDEMLGMPPCPVSDLPEHLRPSRWSRPESTPLHPEPPYPEPPYSKPPYPDPPYPHAPHPNPPDPEPPDIH